MLSALRGLLPIPAPAGPVGTVRRAGPPPLPPALHARPGSPAPSAWTGTRTSSGRFSAAPSGRSGHRSQHLPVPPRLCRPTTQRFSPPSTSWAARWSPWVPTPQPGQRGPLHCRRLPAAAGMRHPLHLPLCGPHPSIYLSLQGGSLPCVIFPVPTSPPWSATYVSRPTAICPMTCAALSAPPGSGSSPR